MQKYRISNSRDEIIKILQVKFKTESRLSVWQKNPETAERDFKCAAKFTSLDPAEGVFTILVEDSQRKHFNPTFETYFLLEVQDFAFKSKTSILYKNTDKHLTFQIPQNVGLKERRSRPRFYVAPENKRNVLAIFESREEERVSFSVSCPVYNISTGGICIIVSKETLCNVKLKSAVELEGLAFYENLSNKSKAIVRNARAHTKKGLRSDDYYALGLEFY